jgi:predicted nucleotide-binding protein
MTALSSTDPRLSDTVQEIVGSTERHYGPVLSSGTILVELVEYGPYGANDESKIFFGLKREENWRKVRDDHLHSIGKSVASEDAERAVGLALGIASTTGNSRAHLEHIVAAILTEDIEANRLLVRLGSIRKLVDNFRDFVFGKYFKNRNAWDEVVPPVPVEPSKKIFIVHGHDGELKEAVARMVSKFNLEPVILHEQARQGRPIIENFSIHAKQSGFAIVLLTADDVGSAGTVAEHAALQARARQNVIFEMGFFVGLLGLGRVCAIYEAGVEMPSDLGGILYIRYDDAGRWQWDIAKEIRAAGYNIDLNKL